MSFPESPEKAFYAAEMLGGLCLALLIYALCRVGWRELLLALTL